MSSQRAQIPDTLRSGSSLYAVLDVLSSGQFGHVTKCLKVSTGQEVALKISNAEEDEFSKREILMQDVLSVLDPVRSNVVQLSETFSFQGRTCLVYEMLDRNLQQLLWDRKYQPLSVSEIRPITRQLLSALQALRKVGVVHADLKPDNVVLVNQETEPFRVKLIDFDMSLLSRELEDGLDLQPRGYRAPEVSLGLPLSSAVDLWSLGCVLAFLYLGHHLFGVSSEYQMMRSMVELLGEPEDGLLAAGSFSCRFFHVERSAEPPVWSLKSPEEYERETGLESEEEWVTCGSLDELVTIHLRIQDLIEVEDRRAFVVLLKGLLDLDPGQRATPAQAACLPFVSMMHLLDRKRVSLYVDRAYELVRNCWFDRMDDDDFGGAELARSDPAPVRRDPAPVRCVLAPARCDPEPASCDPVRRDPPPGSSGAETAPCDPIRCDPVPCDESSPVALKKNWSKEIRKLLSRIRKMFRPKKKIGTEDKIL